MMDRQVFSFIPSSRALWIVAGVLILLIALFLWLPWIQSMQKGRAQLNEFQWLLERREEAVVADVDQTMRDRQEVEQQWAGLQSIIYTSPSSTAAGTEMLRYVHSLAPASGVELRSSSIIPADLSNDPGLLSVDLRGEGTGPSVYEFFYRLSESVPVHRIGRLHMHRSSGQSHLQFEVVLTALWSPEPSGRPVMAGEDGLARLKSHPFDLADFQQISLFGEVDLVEQVTMTVAVQRSGEETYQSGWRVIGVVEGERGASAILRHQDGSGAVVKVGDTVGDEKVTSIESTRVILERDGTRSVMDMPVQPIGVLEREATP